MTVGWVAEQAAVSRHGRLPGHDTAAGEPGHGAGRAAGGVSGHVRRAGAGAQGEAAGGCAQACGTARYGRWTRQLRL